MPDPGDRVISVHVANWEIECCTPPPGVGDVVSWRFDVGGVPDRLVRHEVGVLCELVVPSGPTPQ